MKCALIVGHSIDEKGAENKKYKITEYDYNNTLVDSIIFNYKLLDIKEYTLTKLNRTFGIAELVNRINESNYDFVVSFHCNAYNSDIFGSEFLFYHNSKISKQIADIFRSNYTDIGFTDRGLRPISDNNRGIFLLKETKMPAIICESFFIDNNLEIIDGVFKLQEIAENYTGSIIDTFNYLRRIKNDSKI